MTTTSYCPNCGQAVAPDATFCLHCGAGSSSPGPPVAFRPTPKIGRWERMDRSRRRLLLGLAVGALLANPCGYGVGREAVKQELARSLQSFVSPEPQPITPEEQAIAEATPSPEPGVITDGIWRVGIDVQPGTYRTQASGCYWARLKGFGGSDDVISNGNTSRPSVVTISSTDVGFQSNRCVRWEKVAD